MVYIKKADRVKKEVKVEDVSPEPMGNVERPTVEDKLNEMNSRIDGLLNLIEKVVEQVKPKEEVKKETIEEKLPHTLEEGLPTPAKWREKINQILGHDFEATVEDSSGGNYILKVYVPTHLDRRGVGQKDRDISTGLIRRASDIADVEKWCNLILNTVQKAHNEFKK